MVVASEAESLPVLVSPPPATEPLLLMDLRGLLATSTVKVMAGKLPPAAKASERVQLKVPTVQLQPDPPMAVAVKPMGKVSVTVTVPLVDPLPPLVAVMV